MGVWRTKKVLQFELLATSQACIDLEQGPVREDGEHSGRHQVDQLRPQPCLLCPLGHQQNQAFYDHQARLLILYSWCGLFPAICAVHASQGARMIRGAVQKDERWDQP